MLKTLLRSSWQGKIRIVVKHKHDTSLNLKFISSPAIGLEMNSQVTLKDVARTARVSETTVSLVVNGKASQRGIIPSTQARVMAAIQQLGYQPDLTSRSRALHQVTPRAVAKPDGISNGRSQIEERAPTPIRQQIGLVLSAASQADSLTLVPIQESALLAEGYHLHIAVIPTDPASARERITRLRDEGSIGLIACPSVYSAVTATVAGACPVIVLWQDAAKAMLAALRPNQSPAATQAPTPTPTPAPVPAPPPPVVTPVKPVTPSPAAVTPTVVPPPSPVIAKAPVPEVVEEPIPVAEPVPVPTLETPPESVSASASIPSPEIQETVPAVVSEPIVIPEPVVDEEPPLAPEPVPEPEPVIVEPPAIEPTPEPIAVETLVPETPTPQPEPVSTPAASPEPDIQEAPSTATVTTPEPIPEPVIAETPAVIPEVVPEPVVIEEPPPAPEPVLEPASVIAEPPATEPTAEPIAVEIPVSETPSPQPEPDPVPVPAEVLPEPIIIPTPLAEPVEETTEAAAPAPEPVMEVPIPTPPVTPPPVIITEPEPITEASVEDAEKSKESTKNTPTEDVATPISTDKSPSSEPRL
jgi:hypothetical protein